MDTHDITIVGGGPAGCYLAGILQDRFGVVVLEGKKSVGGKACSGLVSKDIRKFIQVDGIVENELDSCVIHSPAGKKIEMRIRQGTYALDRDKLDSFLAAKVDNIVFESKVTSVKIGGRVEVKTNNRGFKCDFIVGADGNNSIVRRYLGEKPMDSVLGLMTMAQEKDSSGAFEVWFDSEIVKDGFLWRIPRGQRVEYGILGTGVKFDLMEDFFKIRSKGCLCERRASPIPTGFHKTYFDRAILVGDAAAQTKPWSFGGLLYGMECGIVAADVIKRCFAENSFLEKRLKNYEIKWRERIGKSISIGMMFREFYRQLDNKKIENVLNLAGESIKEIDMDDPFMCLFG